MASTTAPVFPEPAKGIGGVFEECVGVDSADALEAQVRYWANFGYNEASVLTHIMNTERSADAFSCARESA